MLSLAPLLAAGFALFMRVPALRRTGLAIQDHLLAGLLPPEIARTVLKYLGRFAANANGLTWLGSLLVLGTALALLFTVENTFNRIWQVKKDRPWLRRLGLYLVLLVLGPPALGASLWATSYVLGASAGLVASLSPRAAFVLDLAPVVLGAAGFASLFHLVPNTDVRWRDAIVGGLLASIAFELGKRGFAFYLLKAPTYRTVYGAFAALPVFLLWVYFSWLVTLGAALLAAGLGPARRQPGRRLSRA